MKTLVTHVTEIVISDLYGSFELYARNAKHRKLEFAHGQHTGSSRVDSLAYAVVRGRHRQQRRGKRNRIQPRQELQTRRSRK